MTTLFRFFLCVFVLLSASSAARADEGKSAHITAQLIAQSPTVSPGGDVVVALDYTAAPKWHTYWVNPGDTGLAPKFTWTLPGGLAAGDILWPTPEPLPALGLMSYGYEGRTVLLVKLHAAANAAAGASLLVHAKVDFLVCADVCVPESLTVSLDLKVGPPAGQGNATIDKALKALPQDAPIVATLAARDGIAAIGFQAPKGNAALQSALSNPGDAYFFPLQGDLLNAPEPQTLDMGADGFTLRSKLAGPAPPTGALGGVLKLGDGMAYTVKLTPGELPASVHGLGAASGGKADTSIGGILLVMLAALLGGMILNLMPCVFPVLSMKTLALSRAGHDKTMARTEALIYGAGAVVSFLVLAAVIVLARALGAQVGWGFQLQSPWVTAGLSAVMLLVALSMVGVLHIGASLQALGGSVALSESRPRLSAFLTGVLAVVVAAPCTAPFMGPAIGVALTQGGVTGFAIFAALGVGFALPFVALTFLIISVPAVANILPRPGPWMANLQRVLSIFMFAAAAWLVWVFAQQVDAFGLALLVIGLLAIVAASVRPRGLPQWVAPVITVAGLILLGAGAAQPPAVHKTAAKVGTLPRTAFNIDTLSALRAADTPVLVDLTAAWCVTCKVNELGALSDASVARAFSDTKTVYMVGDWTNQDAAISHYLSLYGRSGVPLYVYYGAHNAQPVVLPQILQASAVVKVLKAGAVS